MESAFGECVEVLAETIKARRNADEKSYTYRLLTGQADSLLKKLVEESCELTLAAKDALTAQALVDAESERALKATAVYEREKDAVAHARYEAADVVYHLLVILERLGISLDDLAAELNARMTDEMLANRPDAKRIAPEDIRRGK